MTQAQQLLNQYPNLRVNFMFFTDEKLFTVAAPSPRPTHSQNDRFYVCLGTRKKNVNETDSFERDRHSASQSVDAWPMDAGLAV